MAKVITDPKKIKLLLERGVENIYPSREWLEKELKSGRRLKLYLGIDPTAPTLHIGNAIALAKLKQFQELGHNVVLLIGSFTGMIGDPTDKAAARKQLTRKQVLDNAKKYKKQAEKFLNFSQANAAEIVFNHTWLDKLTLKEVAELGMLVTAQQLLERDMFQERLKKGEPIYFTELTYPLLQGYDSVAMGVDGEIGGNDQTFNMLMGRDLLKKMRGREKFVLTMKLLTDPTGKKMGKSEGNMITLEEEAQEMFGKVMSWPDGAIQNGFELCTEVENEVLKKISRQGEREQKLRLAREIVKIYHGEKEAGAAEEEWVRVFSKKERPENAQRITKPRDEVVLVDWLLKHELVTSKSGGRRLIEQGGIKVNGEVIKDPAHRIKFQGGELVKIGKKKFAEVR